MNINDRNLIEKVEWLIKMIKGFRNTLNLLGSQINVGENNIPFGDAEGDLTSISTLDGDYSTIGEAITYNAGVLQVEVENTTGGLNVISNFTGASKAMYMGGSLLQLWELHPSTGAAPELEFFSGGWTGTERDDRPANSSLFSVSSSLVRNGTDLYRYAIEFEGRLGATATATESEVFAAIKLKQTTTGSSNDAVFWESNNYSQVNPSYGSGNMNAGALSKTRSIYLYGAATDGTLIEVEMGGDYADDTAAGVGGVLSNELFFNTTTGKLTVKT